MLKQRIITALALLALLIPAILYPNPLAFGVVAAVLVSAGAWEWARLTQYSPIGSLIAGALCASMCLWSWFGGLAFTPLMALWIAAGAVWVAGGAWLLYGGGAAWLVVPKPLRMAWGVFSLWVAWLAIVQARIMGINFLMSVLVLVWVADIFAYFAGRTFGGRFFARKLAPSISPGKTWEGVCGGLAGILVLTFVWRWADVASAVNQVSFYTRVGNLGTPFLVLSAIFLGAMSVVGDLVESLIKRSAGVKDSSGLLPGHGGVLDRVDALLPVLPLAMMLVSA